MHNVGYSLSVNKVRKVDTSIVHVRLCHVDVTAVSRAIAMNPAYTTLQWKTKYLVPKASSWADTMQ